MNNQQLVLQGFTNFKVNCYANATLQCLSHARQYHEFLPSGFEMNRASRTSQFWHEFLRIMDNHQHHRLTKHQMKTFLDSLFDLFFHDFNEDTQQDAHEFFTFILSCLRENYSLINTQVEVMASFRAVAAVRTRCSFNHEFQNDDEQLLSLDLKLGNGLATVHNYIQDFLENDSVEYFCSSCRQNVSANRTRTFKTLPPILSIHLARIFYENGRKHKIGEHVYIPQGLELPYEHAGRVQHQNYSLFAVVLHSGQADSGHYTCKYIL